MGKLHAITFTQRALRPQTAAKPTHGDTDNCRLVCFPCSRPYTPGSFPEPRVSPHRWGMICFSLPPHPIWDCDTCLRYGFCFLRLGRIPPEKLFISQCCACHFALSTEILFAQDEASGAVIFNGLGGQRSTPVLVTSAPLQLSRWRKLTSSW